MFLSSRSAAKHTALGVGASVCTIVSETLRGARRRSHRPDFLRESDTSKGIKVREVS